MCGIAGFIDFEKKSSRDHLEAMTNKLSHRGPDDGGIEILEVDKARIGLGHRRLSIIDLSEKGHQPMHFKEWSIVYNGEIYNYREIREELRKAGYNHEMNSDTAVILGSFDKWGLKAVERFIGMFAFAIINNKLGKAYFFRDRAGVKPLYYYRKGNLLLFASELKSLHEHPGFEKRINQDSLAIYFQYGYIPAPHSIFHNTFKLKPGCYLDLNLSNEVLEQCTYWDVNTFYNQPKLQISEVDALRETESILSSACQYRMVSDVPVGVFLSGGYDSTGVTALLQKNQTDKIKTFTIGFDREDFNEAPFAKEIAAYLGTDHTEYYCSIREAQEIIPQLSYYYDEPFGDSSAIPTILVSRLAKQKMKVALSADGGDETFGGYGKYDSILNNVDRLNRIPAWIQPYAGSIMNTIHPRNLPIINKKYRYEYIYEGMSTILRNRLISAPQILKYSSQHILQKGLNQLFVNSTTELQTAFDEELKINDFNDSLSKIMAIDYKTYMSDDILTKVDRATMSVSLEGREPLLDHRIIELVARLPSHFKIRDGNKKYLLKQIVHKYVPNNLMDRPKSGFGIPIKDWLRKEMKYLVNEYLSRDKLKVHELFNINFIEGKVKKYLNGEDDDFELIWFVLQFQMWFFRWC